MQSQPKFLIISVIVLSIGCVVAFLALAVIADSRVPLPIPVGATTPTPRIHVTTLFFGRAYVDANGNGQIDPSDPPLAGAMFTARDARGVVASGITASDGHATASIPDVAVRPITLQMQPPKGSSYILIGPQEIVGADVSSSFLFALPPTPSPSQTLPPRPTLTAKPSIVPPATETRAAWSTLLAQARAAEPTRYQFALAQGAQIMPTHDGKSFYVLWFPPHFQTAPRRVMIATLHGHASWAFDEFYLWQPYAAQRGYAILALQWWFGGGEAMNDYYLPLAMFPETMDRQLAQTVIRYAHELSAK